jgi:hypothetical protein
MCIVFPEQVHPSTIFPFPHFYLFLQAMFSGFEKEIILVAHSISETLDILF